MSKNSNLVEPLMQAGFPIEEDQMERHNSLVVEFPVSLGNKIRTLNDVTMWEQLQLCATMQRYWADNQVSCTVSFDQKTEGK